MISEKRCSCGRTLTCISIETHHPENWRFLDASTGEVWALKNGEMKLSGHAGMVTAKENPIKTVSKVLQRGQELLESNPETHILPECDF